MRMSKEIHLLRGQIAIVDDSDYEELMRYRWHANSYGYAVCSLFNKSKETRLFMHRVIMNPPADMQVDHINGNKLDNRRSNLRVCTRAENSKNRKKQSTSRNTYKGVEWSKDHNAWRAKIRVGLRRLTLGSFKTEKEAAMAYNEAALRYHGEFAQLNQF